MPFVVRFKLIWVALASIGGGLCANAQHVHLFSGAVSQQQGSQLILVNRANYDTNSNGGTFPECFFMNDGDPLYPGLYQSDATFVALPATIWTGGPAPNCAATNAYLEGKMVYVTGPAGGEISLWEENEDASATTKLFTQPVGTFTGTNRFNISEGITYPELDPFGHIHGRRFSANKPGLYIVGFQLVDTSTTGAGGGPVHVPSITNYFYFQAGLFCNSMDKTNATVNIRFGAKPFSNYSLEANTNLLSTNWVGIDSYTGNAHSHLHQFTDTNAIASARFYRLRQTN